MTKNQFVLLCEYLEKVLKRENEIEQVLNVYFEGFDSFGNLADNLVTHFIELDNSNIDSDIVMGHIMEIFYDDQTYIYVDETDSNDLICTCSNYEELYDFYFNS